MIEPGRDDRPGGDLEILTGLRTGKRSFYPEYVRSAERLEHAVQALDGISRALVRTAAGSPRTLVEWVVRTAPAPDGEAAVRIVLIDDHAILRQGLRLLLEREHDLQVVGEARSPGEALAIVERTRPTIVLLDMKLSPASDNGGLVLCAELTKRYPGLGVLVLSTFVDDALVVSAIQHGACGYVVKDVDTVELVRAIRLVVRNGSAFDSRSAAAMMRSIHAPRAPSPLTERELNVLRLVASGLSNRRIGAHLHLSETTVKFHVRNIMRKLDATSRAEAVYKATKTGLDLTST